MSLSKNSLWSKGFSARQGIMISVTGKVSHDICHVIVFSGSDHDQN